MEAGMCLQSWVRGFIEGMSVGGGMMVAVGLWLLLMRLGIPAEKLEVTKVVTRYREVGVGSGVGVNGHGTRGATDRPADVPDSGSVRENGV